ncbi:MAG: NADH-quinone oxidoreductase subunit J [Thaumarchaeota archaeon]|nr:NADH-quinone oxidoreductase subunit J [Candidatus Calditenuaceae archaeon]MDW8186816.1 NADH-quinone oxidoreductase subunit J [Nitrososphaerota archaeon]
MDAGLLEAALLLVAALSAIMSIETRSLVRTALWFLIFTASLGLLFIIMGAHLVGLFQILAYSGGAVALLMVVLMFTRRRDETA